MTFAASPIPTHAVDWRFLLSVRKAERFLLFEHRNSDFQRSFRDLDIPIETATRLDDLSLHGGFDLVAAPLGVDAPARTSARGDAFAPIRTLCGLLRPGGSLLFGFESHEISLRAMSRLLNGLGFRSVQFFAAVPDLISPEYILPLDAQGLSFMLAHRYEHRLPRVLLRAISRGWLSPFMGVVRSLLPSYFAVASDGGDSFTDRLTTIVLSNSTRPLDQPLRWTLHSNGGADLNDNLIFLGFERGKDEPSLVAKVPRQPSNNWIAQTEYARHSEIWTLLGADAPSRLPEPIAFAEADDQAALIISYVEGRGLIQSPRQGLWLDSNRLLALMSEAARSLREIHDRASRPLAAGEQLASDLPRKIKTFRYLFSPNESEAHSLTELEHVCAASTSTHKTLIQGDFWHGNLIRRAVHDQLVFVDWQYARWDTDVSLDVYLFLLAGALANVHIEDAQERARGTVELLLQWRPEIIPAYLRAYGETTKLSLLPARHGMLQACVEKATRASLDFGVNQSDAKTWSALFSVLSSLPAQSGFFEGI